MAKLKSIFPFFGSIGEVTGYRGPDGVERVRKKSSLDKERLHRDEAFAASRTAWPYLGMASQAGAGIRHALYPLLKDNKDYATSHRLVGACQKALRERHPDRTPEFFNFMDAKEKLEGFSLVEGRSLWPHLKELVVSEPNYATGLLRIVANGWELSARNLLRSGATHLRWRVIVAALPQGKATQRHFEVLDSEWFGLERKPLPDGSLPPETWVCDVPFAKYLMGDGQAIVAMGIEVAQRFGERYEVMVSVKGFDILRIVGGQGRGSLNSGSSPELEVDLGIGDASFDGHDSLGGDLAPSAEEGCGDFEARVVNALLEDVKLRSGSEEGSLDGATSLLDVQDWEGLVVAGVLAEAVAMAPSAQTGAGIGFAEYGLDCDFHELFGGCDSLDGVSELLGRRKHGESLDGLCGVSESCSSLEHGTATSHCDHGGIQGLGTQVVAQRKLVHAGEIVVDSR